MALGAVARQEGLPPFCRASWLLRKAHMVSVAPHFIMRARRAPFVAGIFIAANFLPLGMAQEEGTWGFSDPARDTSVSHAIPAAGFTQNVPVEAGGQAFGPVDLEGLWLAREDPVRLWFRLRVFELLVGTEEVAGEPTTVYYNVHAVLHDVAMTIKIEVLGVVAPAADDSRPRFIATAATSTLCKDVASDCDAGGVFASLYPDTMEIGFAINKTSLPPNPRTSGRVGVLADDLIEEIWVEAETPLVFYPAAAQPFGRTRLRDRAPDVGAARPLALRHSSPTGAVAISFGDAGNVVVPPGRSWPTPITVSNDADSDVLVDLGYEFWHARHDPAGFSAHGPGRIHVPAGSQLTYHVFITSPHEVEDFEDVRLVLQAYANNRQSTMEYAEAAVVPGNFLNADHDTLYMSSRRAPVFFASVPAEAECSLPFVPNCAVGVLTPNANPDGTALFPENGPECGPPAACVTWTLKTEQPILGTFAIVGDRQAFVQLDLQVPAPVSVASVNVLLVAHSEEFGEVRVIDAMHQTALAYPSSQVRFEATPTPLAFEVPLSAASFRLLINLTSTDPGALLWVLDARPPRIVIGESKIQLPLVDAPAFLAHARPDLPFQVAVTEDVHGTFPAGSVARFPFVVFNQVDYELSLSATVEREGSWAARVTPTDEIVLPGGGEWSGALEITVPSTVKAGETLTAWLVFAAPETEPMRLHFEVVASEGPGEDLDRNVGRKIPALAPFALLVALLLAGVAWHVLRGRKAF